MTRGGAVAGSGARASCWSGAVRGLLVALRVQGDDDDGDNDDGDEEGEGPRPSLPHPQPQPVPPRDAKTMRTPKTKLAVT